MVTEAQQKGLEVQERKFEWNLISLRNKKNQQWTTEDTDGRKRESERYMEWMKDKKGRVKHERVKNE